MTDRGLINVLRAVYLEMCYEKGLWSFNVTRLWFYHRYWSGVAGWETVECPEREFSMGNRGE